MIHRMISDWEDAYANRVNIPRGESWPERWPQLAAAFREELSAAAIEKAKEDIKFEMDNTVQVVIKDGKPVHSGGVEWTIKDGIPYHGPTLMHEVKALVARARADRAAKATTANPR